MKKYCPKCKTTKITSEFGKNKARRDGLQGHCKTCRSTYHSSWYKKNSDTQKLRVRNNKKKIREFIWNYLTEHPCIGCLEADPIVLEFNHRDPSKKSFNISEAPTLGVGIQKLKSEIAKCDVYCANCHRRKTSQFFGWYTGPSGATSSGAGTVS